MRVFNVDMRSRNVSGHNVEILGAPLQFLTVAKGEIEASFSSLRMNVLHANLLSNRLIGLAF